MGSKKKFRITVSPINHKGDTSTVFTFTPHLAKGYDYPNCVWELGDGNALVQQNLNPVSHTFTKAGIYKVVCTCDYFATNSS
ncbi:MAG: hypothetical protein K2Y01_11175, partial [Rhabdochlamydiaceae bacterium]|nr:hypothetical protein [Rhabdochlamydiaceae bacterium]